VLAGPADALDHSVMVLLLLFQIGCRALIQLFIIAAFIVRLRACVGDKKHHQKAKYHACSDPGIEPSAANAWNNGIFNWHEHSMLALTVLCASAWVYVCHSTR
jgi:hypothetical protein